MRRIELLLISGCVVVTAALCWLSAGRAGTSDADGVLTLLPFAVALTGAIVTTLAFLTLRNLTMRRETLRELSAMRLREIAQRQEENQHVVENTTTPVLILTGDKHVIFANRAAQTCFGFGAGELTGVPLSEIVSDLPDSDGPHNALGRMKRGRGLLLDLQCSTWMTAEGDVRITAVIRDLTDENADRQRTARRMSGYAMALRDVGMGVVDIDLKASNWTVCEGFRAVLGVPEDTPAQDHFVLWDRVHGDDIEKLHAADAACIEGRATRQTAEVRVEDGAGDWRWMQWDVRVAAYDSSGAPERLIATLGTVPQAFAQDAKTETGTAAAVAHEVHHALRTRLTAVDGALGTIAQTERGLSATTQRLLDIARSNTGWMRRMLSDDPDGDAGYVDAPQVDVGPLDIAALALQSAGDMTGFANSQHITVGVDSPDGGLRVHAGTLLTKQVFFDLINAACLCAEPDSDVQIKIEDHAGLAMVYVQARGPGLSEEERDAMFKVREGGFGSLHATRQIVQRYGGDMGVESIPGSVTVFWFSCPLAEGETQGADVSPALMSNAS